MKEKPRITFVRIDEEDIKRIKAMNETELLKDIVASQYELQFQASVFDCQWLDALYAELFRRYDDKELSQRARGLISTKGIPKTKTLDEVWNEVSSWEK